MNEETKYVAPKRIFIWLWLLCLIGIWCVLPYSYYLGLFPPSMPIWLVVVVSTMQSGVLFGFACWFSSKILPKTDLHPFDPPHGKAVTLAILSGIAVGLAIYVLDRTIFNGAAPLSTHPPLWTRLLASVYGAVNEEVLLRLFFFTLVYWILNQVYKSRRQWIPLWMTNLLVALLFGLGHLPAFFQIAEPIAFGITRILVLNAIPSLVFGWLYWSRGLLSAMIAHFTTDLVIHVWG